MALLVSTFGCTLLVLSLLSLQHNLSRKLYHQTEFSSEISSWATVQQSFMVHSSPFWVTVDYRAVSDVAQQLNFLRSLQTSLCSMCVCLLKSISFVNVKSQTSQTNFLTSCLRRYNKPLYWFCPTLTRTSWLTKEQGSRQIKHIIGRNLSGGVRVSMDIGNASDNTNYKTFRLIIRKRFVSKDTFKHH